MRRKVMLLEMKLKGLIVDPVTHAPIVLLEEIDGKRTLSIWIGVLEASSIAAEFENLKFSRPMTHDLVREAFFKTGISMQKIEINDLKENIFYATIFVEQDGVEFTLDARPSDAIALALRMKADIFVDSYVVERAKSVTIDEKNIVSKEDGTGKVSDLLEDLSSDSFGKYKM